MPLRRRPLVWLLAVVMLSAVLAWAVQCRREVLPAAVARLAIVNHAPSSWRISMAEVGKNEPRLVKVGPRATLTLEVKPGVYVIAQTLLDIHGQTLDHRTLRWEARAGEVSHWSLVSLQTPLEGDERP